MNLFFPAMLVWRFLYYLMIILGFLGVVLDVPLLEREARVSVKNTLGINEYTGFCSQGTLGLCT